MTTTISPASYAALDNRIDRLLAQRARPRLAHGEFYNPRVQALITCGTARTFQDDSGTWLELTDAAACPTCAEGCHCRGDNPTHGCEHYACWGRKSTSTCPGVPVMRTRMAIAHGLT